jgi:hypothetical protein
MTMATLGDDISFEAGAAVEVVVGFAVSLDEGDFADDEAFIGDWDVDSFFSESKVLFWRLVGKHMNWLILKWNTPGLYTVGKNSVGFVMANSWVVNHPRNDRNKISMDCGKHQLNAVLVI